MTYFLDRFFLPPSLSLTESFPRVKKARVMYECEADSEDEITARAGETVEILNENTSEAGWWEVSIGYITIWTSLSSIDHRLQSNYPNE